MAERHSSEVRPAVLVACALPRQALDALSQTCRIEVLDNPEKPDPGLVAAAAEGKDAIVLSVTLAMTAALVEALPASIRAVGTYSVGTDHIDLDACASRGIRVLTTPDVLSDAVAEVALLLLLGAARRAREASALILGGGWKGWQPTQLNGVGLAGRVLGIFGMGRIGRSIATRARAFGMEIHYSNRRRLSAAQEEGARFHADPADLLAASDALVIACPATPETRGFLDRERLARMRPGGIVVNIGRGAIIDDDALIEALQSGHVRAAGLDVFNNEPHFDERYLTLPTVYMLPHIGSSTIEVRIAMARMLGEGIASLMEAR